MRMCRKWHGRPTPEERRDAERRARASVEARYGHPLTDQEWEEAKANLRQLFSLLASWRLSAHVVVGATDEKKDQRE